MVDLMDLEKNRYGTCKFELFSFVRFQNSEILSGQRVLESEPNGVCRLWFQKNYLPNAPRKKFVLHLEISIFLLIDTEKL